MEGFIVLGTVWMLCGLIAAGIVSSRGGEVYAGFFVGLLFGPLGILAAFFMGNEEGRRKIEVGRGQKKRCPRCAEAVQPEAAVCRYCGHEFKPQEIADSDPFAGEQPQL